MIVALLPLKFEVDWESEEPVLRVALAQRSKHRLPKHEEETERIAERIQQARN
jgi:hypothetical protein